MLLILPKGWFLKHLLLPTIFKFTITHYINVIRMLEQESNNSILVEIDISGIVTYSRAPLPLKEIHIGAQTQWMPNGIYCALYNGRILLFVWDYLKQEVSKHWNLFDCNYLRIVTCLYLFSSSEKFRLLLIDCIWD